VTAPGFLCIGDIDVDVLIGVDELPTCDGKVNGRMLQRVPGGMAGNVAVALARLGARVRVLGRIGDDAEGAFALGGLVAAGVDTGFVARLAGTHTFSCIALLTPDGEKSLVKLMTEAYRPDAADLVPGACEGVAHIHLTSVGDAALCRRVVAMARDAGASASLDIERADCPADRVELRAAVAGFDILFCNTESRAALKEILQTPLTQLAPAVVTTLGAQGARVEAGGVAIDAPGIAVAVADTTGAGDCFAAACLYARIVRGDGWTAALRFANHAAALSTTGLGAQSALPTLAEVEAAIGT
jgi:ribokinase